MKILLTGNCQVDGIHVFLERACPQHEIRRLPHLATFYGEFSEERIAEDHAWADTVFFHHKHDGAQNYPTKNPKVPLSVWFQDSPFIIQKHDENWAQVGDYASVHGRAEAIEWAVKVADMRYEQRWSECASRMIEKEENEKVPEEIRMSDMMELGRARQLQITCNHPSSIVFREWALKICRFLGDAPADGYFSEYQAELHRNIAGLPCEESATTAAVKHLGLGWGGRAEDDESGREVARDRLCRLFPHHDR